MSSPDQTPTELPVALHRSDQFVGRTMNWLYDHLRLAPRYRIVVFSDTLENRDEFPLLEARNFNRWSFHRLKWLAPCLLHSHSGYTAVGDLLLQKRLDLPCVVSFYGADVYQLGQRAEWRDRYRQVFDRALHVLALVPVMARSGPSPWSGTRACQSSCIWSGTRQGRRVIGTRNGRCSTRSAP